MAGPLVETKLYRPRTRPGAGGTATSRRPPAAEDGVGLTLVSAPAGFGKTTLVCVLAGRADRGVGVAGGERPGAPHLLDLRLDRVGTRGTGRGRGRSGGAAVESDADRDGPRRRAQRARRAPGRCGPRARRLPPRRRRRRSRRRWRSCSTTCRPQRAPGDQHSAPTPPCRWPGCARAASWSRSAPPTCASRSTRWRPTSTV